MINIFLPFKKKKKKCMQGTQLFTLGLYLLWMALFFLFPRPYRIINRHFVGGLTKTFGD